MSAPIDQSTFSLDTDEPLVITATLWRGAMIERFARIEFFVARSLEICARAKLVSPSEANAVLPRDRFDALLAALRHEALAAISGPARRSLAFARDISADKNSLCNGRVTARQGTIRIEWTAFDTGVARAEIVRLTPIEILERLAELDRLTKVLEKELASVDKVSRALGIQPL
ncbi:hypothetical protein GRI40_09220 [Altererythrobacter aerius]|uniref:Uncharacterized protein n=1 Tax=Tsuneonella aeria TaxID=1837929 RepID=A0A6I4TDT6_9SPHN|nr:hypothetical protein [Tsuneonella aeria]MXO75392.1 hypothetical protein [Tsuneonella aeria]